MGGNKVFIFFIQELCSRYLLKNINLVSYDYIVLITNIYISKINAVKTSDFQFLFFVSVFTQMNLCRDNFVIGRDIFKSGVCFIVYDAIHLLPVYYYII